MLFGKEMVFYKDNIYYVDNDGAYIHKKHWCTLVKKVSVVNLWELIIIIRLMQA